MPRTTTVQKVRDRWASLCGLDKDELILADADNFLEFLNINYRSAWMMAEWPFAFKIFPEVLNDNLFIDLSSNTEISEAIQVYDVNPYLDRSASILRKESVENDVEEGLYVYNGTAGIEQSVATLVSTGTTATATITDHGYSTNDSIQISGANESDYNGTFTITVTDKDTFTYTMAADPVDTATGTIVAIKCTAFIYARLRETEFSQLTDLVPFKLQDYLARACYADYLAAEGQVDKSLAQKSLAKNIILDEIDRLERQQDQQPVTKNKPRQVGVR